MTRLWGAFFEAASIEVTKSEQIRMISEGVECRKVLTVKCDVEEV